MIIRLFSIFDPVALFFLPLNWIIIFVSILFLPTPFWKINSYSLIVINLINKILTKEFKALFSINILIKGATLLPIRLFILILINNLLRNFPYTFCLRAHLRFSISLSLPIWLSIIIFYWINITKSILAHLVPTGTPRILIPLIVIIELTSNIIRPIALAVRLTANLIAGHLLIALLGNTFNPSSYLCILIFILQILFLRFELIVGIIQSYVFSVLITLYSREIS